MSQVTLNAHVYSYDGTTARDMLNGGSKTWLVPMISDSMVEVAKATAAALAAAASAATAAAGAAAMVGTSVTSNAIGTGSKSFVTQPGKSFPNPAFLLIASSVTSSAYMIGQVSTYNATTGALTATITDIGPTTGTFASWNISVTSKPGATGAAGNASIGYAARSSNIMLVAADKLKIIECTGTFTQTFDTAPNIGAGWSVFFQNAGSGTVTLAPSGYTIDGVASIPINAGQSCLIEHDGTNLHTIKLASGTSGEMIVWDQKAANVTGGSSSAGLQTRVLNTVGFNTISGASLASNQVTLPAGTYRLNAIAAVTLSGAGHRCIINNDTAASVVGLGSAQAGSGTSQAECYVTITGTSAFSVQHYVTTAGAAFGPAVADANPSIFAILKIKRLA